MRIGAEDPVDEKLFEICAEQFVRQQAAVDLEQSQRIERVIFFPAMYSIVRTRVVV